MSLGTSGTELLFASLAWIEKEAEDGLDYAIATVCPRGTIPFAFS